MALKNYGTCTNILSNNYAQCNLLKSVLCPGSDAISGILEGNMEKPAMPDFDTPPPFFSVEFHLRFFPGLIRRIVFPKKDLDGTACRRSTGFVSGMDHMIVLAVCLVSFFAGMPGALQKGSVVGWVFGLAGAVGVIALTVMSIVSQRGIRPSYRDFRILTFTFLVFTALTGGLALAQALHLSYGLRILLGAAGTMAGYFLGIMAGLWVQRLGWISTVVDLLAGLSVFGLVIIDIILLI